MKRLFVMSLAVLFTLGTIQVLAQQTKKETKTERKALRKLKAGEVSYMSQQQFIADFGNIPDVKWYRSDNFDEATFTKDGLKMTAFYDSESKLVGTTSHKTFADLPAAAQKEIQKRYKDYTIGPVVFFDDNELNDTDMALFGVQFEDEDNYFVELTKANEKIIVQANPRGEVFFFTQL